MTAFVKPAPKYAPGSGVADALGRSQKWVKAAAVAYDDTSPINLFEVPGDVLIVGGIVNVDSAFDPAGTSAAPTVAITAPDVDDTTVTVWDAAGVGLLTTGKKPFTNFAQTPASGGYVIATYTAGTTTAGGFEVWLAYVELADQL